MEEVTKDTVRLVMSFSPFYLDYAAVTMWSVMLSLRKGAKAQLTVLHAGLAEEGIRRFSGAFREWENLSIGFADVTPFAEKYGLPPEAVKAQPTCYPLLCTELFPQEEKILLLDGDLIVKRDITGLWNTPLRDDLIAAVADVDFNGQIRSRNRQYRRYYSSIGLNDPEGYIQAGVVLYNLRKMRETFTEGELFRQAILGGYRYADQDVLNLRCGGRICYLDMRWNVLHDNGGFRMRYIASMAGAELFRQYREARKDPWIIHFAGNQKPWENRRCDFADDFWQVAEQTPVADSIRERYPDPGHRLAGTLIRQTHKWYYRLRWLVKRKYRS